MSKYYYDCPCPICGHMNMKLDLEDSNGHLECEACGSLERVPNYQEIPDVAKKITGNKPAKWIYFLLSEEAVVCI